MKQTTYNEIINGNPMNLQAIADLFTYNNPKELAEKLDDIIYKLGQMLSFIIESSLDKDELHNFEAFIPSPDHFFYLKEIADTLKKIEQ